MPACAPVIVAERISAASAPTALSLNARWIPIAIAPRLHRRRQSPTEGRPSRGRAMLWGMPNGLPEPGRGPSEIRARFPALNRTSNGRPCVFADAPGGTQVPDTVIEAMAGYLRRSNANTGGAFDPSRETDALIAEARRAAARLLGADPDEVSFGQNTTSLAFALSRSIAGELEPSDE